MDVAIEDDLLPQALEVEDGDEANAPTVKEVEYAQTAARYDEVLSKCKLLRARLLFTTANFSESSNSQEAGQSKSIDVLGSLDEMEAKMQHLSIQEEMLKQIKVSKLALELFNSEGPDEVLDDLLKEHCANQAKLYELAQDLTKERLAHKKGNCMVLDRLCEYTACLKKDQMKLSEPSSSNSNSKCDMKLKKSLEKQIKEIRFMQLCISNIVGNLDVDLRKEKKVREIVRSVRDPITSIEHFL